MDEQWRGERERERERERETDGETNSFTPNVERERERCVFLLGLEIGMALTTVINEILLKIFVIMGVFFLTVGSA